MDSRGGRPTKDESENDAEGHGVNTEIWRTQGDARKEEESIGRKENGREELKDETTREGQDRCRIERKIRSEKSENIYERLLATEAKGC